MYNIGQKINDTKTTQMTEKPCNIRERHCIRNPMLYPAELRAQLIELLDFEGLFYQFGIFFASTIFCIFLHFNTINDTINDTIFLYIFCLLFIKHIQFAYKIPWGII